MTLALVASLVATSTALPGCKIHPDHLVHSLVRSSPQFLSRCRRQYRLSRPNSGFPGGRRHASLLVGGDRQALAVPG